MGEPAASVSSDPPGNQLARGLPPALCQAGCGRPATKASAGRWCYWDDPAVPAAEKLQARQLGGRRGAMTPAEVVQALENADLDSREGRQRLRERFLSLRLAGRITTGEYRDVLAAVDGAAREQLKAATPPARPLVVEVERPGVRVHRVEAGS